MSREFMAVCGIERSRLLQRIATTEEVLRYYRELWKIYGELAKVAQNPAAWKVAQKFIEETVSPILKRELAGYKESLENVTRAQAQGCMEVANAG